MNIIVLGLSITSSWGNGHATTWRALCRALANNGHRVLFLERDQTWYAENRDLTQPPWLDLYLYDTTAELQNRWTECIREADVVMLGSYLRDGVRIAHWVQQNAKGIKAFYDIDTPVTLAGLAQGTCKYLTPELIPGFDLYLSFSGGPALKILQDDYGARAAKPLYCSVDTELYHPMHVKKCWQLGYLGTYSEDRQPALKQLLLKPAWRCPSLRFIIAGAQYPQDLSAPNNVEHLEHLPPYAHHYFYNRQRFTLNLTRADMRRMGWSPSVRLFEAAACGTPIISDRWEGIEEFFVPGREILLVDNTDDVLSIFHELPESSRLEIARQAWRRVLKDHSAQARAATLENYLRKVGGRVKAA